MTSDTGSTDPGVHTAETDTADLGNPASNQLKRVLRRVFESQIPNYGDYNLVLATPGLDGETGFYVLGYRWRPAEVVFAPFDVDTLAGLEVPTSVNTTNLSHTDELDTDAYEVGTSTGRVFQFAVEAQATLPATASAGERLLEQSADWEDFRSFVDSYLELA
ncbi:MULTISPECIES: hypothetical protein [unclassified Arthrobacter]|uniref:hypothetical protein n=1 Tax=unclassified Arthrobacter TaxID=235627 RepID=UPI002104D5A2|nr:MULTISPECIES: hypothetical protein [unclassified Arthrobacter]MCQ1945232.1 hypothetical protein [Arthrobacter sp. zg-Y1116]MCQ1985177.1 hypothetical protein [Arthrobacter sp. zg-Y844]MCQ1995107.1 hypothetical protein [Arthrobacter sp. zg-Y1171]UWX80845.1 hypothetical protein N2L00_10485 [Arthrobacter sp. zg-Y1171]